MEVCERERIAEWMDEPNLDAALHEQALSAIRRINTFSFTSAFLARRIAVIARARGLNHLRVLDVGSGGGDNALGMAKYLRRHGFRPRIDGWDISATAVRIANEAARRVGEPAVQFMERDALAVDYSQRYDFFVSSLFLHHLERTDAERLLVNMAAQANVGVVVSDLLRSKAGYWLAWAGCRLLTRSPVVRFDGPASVQSAYSMPEIRELIRSSGLTGASLSRHWPQRFLLTWTTQP